MSAKQRRKTSSPCHW